MDWNTKQSGGITLAKTIGESGSLYQVIGEIEKNEETTIKVEVSEFRGSPRIDIREYVENGRYTGATKKGINIDVEQFPELFKVMVAVKKHLEEKGVLVLDERPTGK